MKRPAFNSKRAKLGKRLGPGFWTDQNGALHVSIPELLAACELPDTAENRRMVEEIALETMAQTGMEFQKVQNRLDIDYQPDGGPRYWMDEATGTLRRVVDAFLNETKETPVAADDFDILKAYLLHWIEAPIFRISETERASLVHDTEHAADTKALRVVFGRLLDHGIDPL